MSDRPGAVITGASGGIGQAVAVLLAAEGYDVALLGRDAARLDAACEAVKQENADVDCLAIPGNLTDPAYCRSAVERAAQRFGRLDVLAHVAGSAALVPVEKITPEAWRTIVDVNLSSAVYLAAAAWPTFTAQKRGVVVNVSSMSSVDPFPQFSMYAAAKAGLNMFTRCLAQEGRRVNVKAVAVAPGAVETTMLRALWNEKALPRSKTLDPVEVAAVIRDCVTGQREFENGSVVLVPSP